MPAILLTNQTKAEIAAQMAISDAIERGATEEGLREYIKTETFKNCVIRYMQLMEFEF